MKYQLIGIFIKVKLSQFRLMLKYLTFLLVYLITLTQVLAQEVVRINSDISYRTIGSNLEYLSSQRDQYSINQLLESDSIQFVRNKHELLLFNEDEYQEDLWLRFKLENIDTLNNDYILHLNNPLINYIEYFEVRNGKVVKHNITGDDFPMNSRIVRFRNPIYPLEIVPGDSVCIYFKINLDGRKIHIPLSVYTQGYFIENTAKKEVELGFFYGVLACLSCVCFIIYYLLREKVYVYLASYYISQTILQLSVSGIAFVLIWPNFHFIADRSVPILMSLSIFLALVFLIEFLGKHKISRWVLIAIRYLQALSIAILIGSFTNGISYNLSIWLLYRIIPIFYIGFFVLSTYIFLTKYIPARFFFLAFSFSLLSIFSMYYFSITRTNNNIFTNTMVIYGEMFKSIILLLAVLDRLRIFKFEKELAQVKLIEHLEEMNLYKEKLNNELVQKIEETSQELSVKQMEVKRALIWGEEQERKRIAQELHDGMGSLLSTLRLNAESIDLTNKNLSNSELQAYQNVIELIEKACVELRTISHNMMPVGIEQFGLVQQLISIIRKLNSLNQVQFTLNTFGLEERFDKEMELGLYRICLEIINNIIKHAEAKNASIQLIRNEDTLNVIIEDDGKGFDSNSMSEGLGLKNIKTRVDAFGGKLSVDSKLNRGTIIIIDLPLNQ